LQAGTHGLLPLSSVIGDCTMRKANLAPLSCKHAVNKADAPRPQSSCSQGSDCMLGQELLNRRLPGDTVMAKAPQRCHFWRLSPELRLMIFDFAYGREKNIKLIRISRTNRSASVYQDEEGNSQHYNLVRSGCGTAQLQNPWTRHPLTSRTTLMSWTAIKESGQTQTRTIRLCGRTCKRTLRTLYVKC
jgi:hypothetical protein